MLLDFWITSETVRSPCGWESLMTNPPIVMRPGAVWHLADGGFGHPVLRHPKTILYKAAIWVRWPVISSVFSIMKPPVCPVVRMSSCAARC